MNNEYIFHVGDEVITDDGRVGKITSICTCDRCEARGFYEPSVKFEYEDYSNYITHWDYESGFERYYKIGDYLFRNLDLESVQRLIDKHEESLIKLYRNRKVVLQLMEEQNEME